MNARHMIAKLDGYGGFIPFNSEELEVTLRALRLLAAAEANDGTTPETDANAAYAHFPDDYPRTDAALAIDADFCRAMERERNGLAARVRELEPDAERYRFLKDGLWDDYLTGVIEMRKNAIWDAAIDAARSK